MIKIVIRMIKTPAAATAAPGEARVVTVAGVELHGYRIIYSKRRQLYDYIKKRIRFTA